jgi:CrcB protein
MSSSAAASTGTPVDPDVGTPRRAARPRAFDPLVLSAIAAGAVLGSEARYALSLALPHSAGHWPVATWWTNLTGSFLLGALMVVLTELTSPHRLVRPFLGVGVLGGYTTFSTAMVDTRQLLDSGSWELAWAYLVGTAGAVLLAVLLGATLVRAAAAAGRRLAVRRRGRR